MAKVVGVDKVKYKINARLKGVRASKRPTAVVGFAMPYAIYVHENLNANHKQGTFAKYLEMPSRIYEKEILEVVAETYNATKSLEAAVLAGALFLQRISLQITPIDTGALRASSYVALQRNVRSAQSQALRRGQAIRDIVLKSRKKT